MGAWRLVWILTIPSVNRAVSDPTKVTMMTLANIEIAFLRIVHFLEDWWHRTSTHENSLVISQMFLSSYMPLFFCFQQALLTKDRPSRTLHARVLTGMLTCRGLQKTQTMVFTGEPSNSSPQIFVSKVPANHDPLEAELTKYVQRCFGAYSGDLFNACREYCEEDGELTAHTRFHTGCLLSLVTSIAPTYVQGPDGKFGYGGGGAPGISLRAFTKMNPGTPSASSCPLHELNVHFRGEGRLSAHPKAAGKRRDAADQNPLSASISYWVVNRTNRYKSFK